MRMISAAFIEIETPVLLRFMFRLGPVVYHSNFHHFIRSDKFIIKSSAAVVCWSELFENRVPVLIDAVFIDRTGYHLSHHGQAMQPLFSPDDLALVVRFAFRYAGRLECARRNRRQTRFLESR